MAYTTAASVKSYLGIAEDDDDSLIADLILRAQAIIDTLTKRTFEAAGDATRYYTEEAIDGKSLILDDDLCAITTVTNGDEASTVIASSDYRTYPRNETPYFAIRIRDGVDAAWDASDSDIAVTGKWAYSASAPSDIVHCAVRLTAYLYRQKDNHIDLDRAVMGATAVILPSDLPADMTKILQSYRRLVPQ